MAATALTLRSALANATQVFNKRSELYLNRNFEIVKDVAQRATFEELMDKISELQSSETDKDKKRLMVILKMTNPSSKTSDEKGPAPKKEDALKSHIETALAVVKAKKDKPKAEQSVKDALKNPSSLIMGLALPKEFPKVREAQIQCTLSWLLAAYEYIYIEYQWMTHAVLSQKLFNVVLHKIHPLINVSFDKSNIYVHLDPDQFSNLAFSAFIFKWAKMFKSKSYELNLNQITYQDYETLCRLRSHPDEEMRKIADLLCTMKEILSHLKKVRRDEYYKISDFLLPSLQKPEIREFFEEVFPIIIELLETPEPREKNKNETFNIAHLQKRREIGRRGTKLFFPIYKKLYEELHRIRATKYSQPKEKRWFLDRYNCPAFESFISGRHATAFLPPEKLREELSLEQIEREASSKTPEPLPEKESTDGKKKEPIASAASSKDVPGSKVAPQVVASIEPALEKSSIEAILKNREFPFDEITYDQRVLEWFSQRKEVPIGFTPEDAVWKHAFTSILEWFLGTPYCFRDTWQNPKSGKQDPCFCILADITFPNKETVPGVFQFTFDENWVCYHRWFGSMSNIDRLDKLITQRREKIDFPPLGRSKAKFEEARKTKFEIDPFFGSITFEDKENGLIIKIYKARD